MPYKDPEKKREHDRLYRETHREEIRVFNKNYRDGHPEEERARHKKYGDEHKPQRHEYYELNKNYFIDKTRLRRIENPDCRIEEGVKYRGKYKELINFKNKQLKIDTINFIAKSYNAEVKCWRCDEKRIWCLTIGHVDQSGKEDRKTMGGQKIYRKILSGEKKLDGINIECVNCNMSKQWWGKYPDEIPKKHIDVDTIDNKAVRTKRRQKMKVFETIAKHHDTEIKCWRCGTGNQWVLSIGHPGETGNLDRKIYKGTHAFRKAIIDETRTCDDLQIECMNCNCCLEWYGKYPDEINNETFKELTI